MWDFIIFQFLTFASSSLSLNFVKIFTSVS
nr:MAG TPA: hypothetical protein [Caudoviricetes sp.]DAY45048.1 MAG TPA: hypothetical protein [Caudoviricetes sp.]